MPDFRSGRPRFRAGLSADVALPAGFSTIPWDDVDYDDVGAYDGVDTYTLDRPGLYLVTAQLQRRPIATSSAVTVRISINGVTEQSLIGAPTAAVITVACTALLLLEGGDQVTVEGQGSATLGWSAGNSQSFVALARISPKRWT